MINRSPTEKVVSDDDSSTTKSLLPVVPDDCSSEKTLPSVTSSSSTKKSYETPWNSVYTCGCCSFIQAAQFSIYFSSMWPYYRKLDPNGTERMYGFILTMFSVAQCIAAPSFGYWSNRIEQVRLPLTVGFINMLAGTLLYLALEHVPVESVPYVMMLARFVTGTGTGNASLLRAYVGTASTKNDRMRAIACVSGGLAVGTMVGPAFQLMFSPLGETGFNLYFITIDIYTSPAIFAFFLNIVGLVLVRYVFVEHDLAFEVEGNDKKASQISPDMIAIAIVIVTRFSQIFVQTTIETINSPYSMMMFGLDREDSVTVNSGAHAIGGLAAAILYVFFIFFNAGKRLNQRITCMLAITLFGSMFIITYSYPFLPTIVDLRVNGTDSGCDDERFNWCHNLTVVSPWLYYTFYILTFGIAFSFLNVTLNTLFVGIIGPRRQGTYQGIFQMSGSIGRMLAPLITSQLYTLFGPRSVWIMQSSEVGFDLLLWILFFRRMIPLEERLRNSVSTEA